MPLYRAVMTLDHNSGLPENDVQMNLYFDVSPGNEVAAEAAIVAALNDFIGVDGGPAGLSQYLAPVITRADGFSIKLYSKVPGEAEWGSPIVEAGAADLQAPIGGTGSSLPSETALCLSYHASLTDIPEEEAGGARPASRRRGRVYFGPLAVGSATTGGNQVARPVAGLITAGNAAMEGLEADSAGDPNWTWVAVHRANFGDYSSLPVVGGWVDNAFDSQRRRGEAATGRTEWAA